MTYPASEASVYGGKPVTLYKFMLNATGFFITDPVTGDSFVLPPPPPAPGAIVVRWDGPDGSSPLRDEHENLSTLFNPECTGIVDCYDPINPLLGGNCIGECTSGCSMNVMYGTRRGTICASYGGGIGGSGGYLYQRYEFNPAMGLEPNHDYVVRVIQWVRASGLGFEAKGTRIIQDGNGQVGAADAGLGLTPEYFDIEVSTGATGILYVDLGAFDLEVLSAYVVMFGGLAIYDAEVPPGPTDPPGPEDGDVYRRTSFRRSVTYLEEKYTAQAIEHSELVLGTQDNEGTIQITLPLDDPLVTALLSPISPTRPMVQIYQYHRPPVNEPDPADVITGLFDITNIETVGKEATLTCASILGQGDILVPTGLVQRDYCTWVTYDPLTCGVNPAEHTFNGVVSAITGMLVTVDGAGAFNADPTYFQLGVFTSHGKRTMIKSQDGDVMELDEFIPGLTVGDPVSLLAGDDRTKETCFNRFDNSARRMSFPDLPVKNPYYGQGLRP